MLPLPMACTITRHHHAQIPREEEEEDEEEVIDHFPFSPLHLLRPRLRVRPLMMTRRRTNGSSLPPLNIAKGARHIEQEYQVAQKGSMQKSMANLTSLGLAKGTLKPNSQ